MTHESKITTQMQSLDGKILCGFANHAPLEVSGLSGIENRPDSWSPPHMLVASAETCFYLTLLSVAEKMKIGIKSYSSETNASVASEDGKHYEVSNIFIHPKIELQNESDRAKLPQLFKLAKDYCLVARSLKTNVEFKL